LEFVGKILVAIRKCKEINENVDIDDTMFESLTTPELAKEAIGYIAKRLEEDKTQTIVSKLLDFIDNIGDIVTMRNVIWMICEYSTDSEKVIDTFKNIIVDIEKRKEDQEIEEFIEEEIPKVKESQTTTKVVVLADGTYGSVIDTSEVTPQMNKVTIGLKKMIEMMDNMIVSVIAIGLSKLCLNKKGKEGNKIRAKALQIILEIMKIEQRGNNKLSNDCKERIRLAINIITGKCEDILEVSEAMQKEICKEINEHKKFSSYIS